MQHDRLKLVVPDDGANVVSDGSFSLQAIQCGMARISMVARTGSPSQPRRKRSCRARTDWS